MRFPEFTGEWHKHSLGEIGETIIGLTYKPSDVVEHNGVIVFRSSNIKNGVIDYSDLVRVNKQIKDRIITKENDILVCARNGSQRLIGKNAIIKQEDTNNTFGAFMMVYRSIDNPFILPLLSTKRYFSQVGENLGARINQITTSDFNGFEFYFPESHAERAKIAELFRLLDKRIATQNKIIEKLESLIRGIVTKICSGAFVKGKYVFLRDILIERHIKNTENYEVYSVSVSQGIINQIDYLGRSFAAKETLHYNVVNYGDIVYTKSPTGDFPYGIVKRSHILKPVAVSPLYGVYQPKNDYIGKYLHLYFKSPINTKNYLHRLIQKGAKNTINITNSHFLDNNVFIPEKPELINIVNLTSAIEDKLVLASRMLDSLKSQKGYLLSKMFI
ncbi:restriction endonuclease subunit S [Alistipes putredinis]|uniref:restriction endonuclease subunit S n=1 Tax=Alistipes putredinis TaxID=28117 RepID=UPI003AF11944